VCALGDEVSAAPYTGVVARARGVDARAWWCWSAAAAHTGAVVQSRRCGAVCALDDDGVAAAIHLELTCVPGELLRRPHTGAVAHA